MISIIVPVYNVEKYLGQCLQSIFNQTYKDFEVVIVNDGSTDESASIIASFLGRYHNINYIKQKNKGISEVRNLAIRHCKGEFIVFIDSDDYVNPNYLQVLYDTLVENSVDMVIGGYNIVYDDVIDGKNKSVTYEFNSNKVYSGEHIANAMLELKVDGYLWNRIFKKDILFKNNFCFEKDRDIEDWYPLFRLTYNTEKIMFTNIELYNYRQRADSAVHKKNKKLLDDYVYATSNIANYAIKNNLDKRGIMFFQTRTFISSLIDYYEIDSNNTILKFEQEYLNYSYKLNNILLNNRINNSLKLAILLYKSKSIRLVYFTHKIKSFLK